MGFSQLMIEKNTPHSTTYANFTTVMTAEYRQKKGEIGGSMRLNCQSPMAGSIAKMTWLSTNAILICHKLSNYLRKIWIWHYKNLGRNKSTWLNIDNITYFSSFWIWNLEFLDCFDLSIQDVRPNVFFNCEHIRYHVFSSEICSLYTLLNAFVLFIC